MQITLNQQHLEAAVKAYVAKAGIVFPVEDVNFTAGRGRDGMTATVNVEDPFAAASTQPDEPAETPAAKTPRKAEPKAESKKEAAPEKEEAKEPEPVNEEPEPAAEEPKKAPPFSPEEEEAPAAEKPKAAKASLFS